MLSSRWDSLWRNRRTPWLLLITLVALAGIALWVFLDYQRTVQALAVRSEYHMTRLAAARIREELADFPNALVTLARSADMTNQDPAVQAGALQKATLIQEGLFDGMILLDNFGSVRAAEPARPDILGRDWSDRTYFRELLSASPSTVVFSNAVNDGPAGTQVIMVSVPLLDGQGRFMGAVAGMLRLSQSTLSPYYATLVKLRVSPDGTVYLVDRSGKILFDSASLRNGEQYTNHPLPRSGEADAAETLRTRDPTGREILISHAPIPGTPWTLVIEKDWENLVAPTRGQADLLLALLSLAVILPFVSLALLVRQYNNRGDFDNPIPPESQLARHLEHTLLCEQEPVLPGWQIKVQREPAPLAGKVFYDLLIGSDGCLTLIIAEIGKLSAVSNGTISTALTMVTVRTLLRSAARSLLPPAEALDHTNRLLCPEIPPEDFVTCIYCRMDPASGAVTVANADHVRPLKISGGVVDAVGGQGPPLALEYLSQYGEYETMLARGDSMLLYSSEVLEARNANGERFGFARLERALTTPGYEDVEQIDTVAKAIRTFAGGAWASERDGVLIVLERLDNGAAP
jgi:serine phosphatase RsbU (regulator of sigma subunit)